MSLYLCTIRERETEDPKEKTKMEKMKWSKDWGGDTWEKIGRTQNFYFS